MTWFAAPHSYTGEDVVEISGARQSRCCSQRIVELAMQAGARLAEPGEFTLRAYLNGRIDLVQAEAVADLVDAVTPLQARAAMDQLEGTLTAAIAAHRRARCSIWPRGSRRRSIFPTRDFISSRATTRARSSRAFAASSRRSPAEGRAGRVRARRPARRHRRAAERRESRACSTRWPARRARSSRDIAGTTRDVLTERVDIGGVP